MTSLATLSQPHSRLLRRQLSRLAVGIALGLGCHPATAQQVSSPESGFSIGAMSMEDGLIEFAQQANLTLIFPFERVSGMQVNPVVGNMSPEEALQHLLHGTGLEASFSNKGIVSISVVEKKANDGVLSTIKSLFADDGDKMLTTPEPSPPQIEYVKVRGIRASVQRSQDVKYHALGIVDSIQAEEIGKFPDLNLAESLQRITGVSIDRSEGEGQFVTVRGFGPEFNGVLINGRKLPTDNLGREFSFDTLPSELVSGVSVFKTSSASQITGGVGSIIDIQTARPMQARGFKVAGHVKALYDTNRKSSAPQGALVVSHSNQKFGWLVSLSHQEREARIDEAQIDGWLPNTDVPQAQLSTSATHLFVPRNYDHRVRFDTRTRTSGTLVMQYRPNADVDMTLDYVSSQFDIQTDSTSMGHWFTSSNLEDVLTDDNGTVVHFSQQVGHATDFHARTFNRPSEMQAVGLNIEWQATKALSLELDIGSATNSIKDTAGGANALTLIGYLNRSTFDHRAGHTLPLITGFESADPSIVNAEGEAAGVANYLDPANGRAHVMLRRGWQIDDTLDQFRLDGVWSADTTRPIVDVHFGAMFISQHKVNNRWDNEANAVHCTYCGYFANPEIPDEFQTVFNAGAGFLSGISGHESVPRVWLRHNGEQLLDYLENVDGVSFAPVLRDSSFAVKEDIMSWYSQLMISHDWGEIEIETQLGIRYETTQTQVTGFESQLARLEILDQTELAPITVDTQPIEHDNNYAHWLPSVQSKWQLSDDIVMRLAYSETITRPTLTQMSPSLIFNTTRQGGDLRASQGNPNLRPFEARNIDLSLEWYPSERSYASVAYFRKSVDNFIVSQVNQEAFDNVVDPSSGSDSTAPDPDDQLALFDVTRPVNAQTAVVEGVELAYQYQFDSGFGVIANTTLIDSNAELDRDNLSQKFALTGLSDTQNLIVFYDSQPLQVRVAWNRRGEFLQSLTQRQSSEPVYVESYSQLDASASYALNDHVSVFVEGINITEESVLKHGRYDNQLLLAQSPGARYSLGIRGSF